MVLMCFDNDWLFHLGEAPAGPNWIKADAPDYDDSGWRTLDLPHDYSIELPRNPNAPGGAGVGFFPTGVGWYRKYFVLPEADRGKVIRIEFEGVYMNAEVWLNGRYLGRHPYGYTGFVYDLTPYAVFGGERNLLAVRVDTSAQPNSRWYSGSGIYRHVWLMVTDPVHIATWGVGITTPKVSAEEAVLRLGTTVVNRDAIGHDVTVRWLLRDPDGKEAGRTEASAGIAACGRAELTGELRIAAPRLWSVETPHLYTVETEVLAGGRKTDEASTPCGLRSLDFSADKGFLLNGEPLKLRGGCVHHDCGPLGAASFDRAEERKVELLKANGFNAVRCAHNPPAPAFLDACDRLGLLVIDEAFDCWRMGKNPYDYHINFDDWWRRDIESMVRRDRNHPSIIMWSIGNEVMERGLPEGASIARMLAGRVRELDPTRPVTAGVNRFAGDWNLLDDFFAALDVCGYNYEYRRYGPDHERHPGRIIYGSESAPMEVCENWQEIDAARHVIGDFVWTALDYLGEAGIGRVHWDGDKPSFFGDFPWHQANCGDLDLCGWKRPQSHYRDIIWGRGERLYIAVHAPAPAGKVPAVTYWGWPDVRPSWTWPGQEGMKLRVDVYSACEEVELLLNGVSLGRKPAGKAEKHIAAFEVPYETGTLEAIGYTSGVAVAGCRLETAGAGVRLRLTPDRVSIKAVRGDLSFVAVEVVDAAGRVNPTAGDSVSFAVSGPGTLAAVGSADPTSTEPYRGGQRRVFRGRCLAVVAANGTPGEIRLRAEAAGLETAEAAIQASI